MDATQVGAEVRSLVLAFDRAFNPSSEHAADVARHCFRLRFALARLDEQSHAAVMQSAFYTQARFDAALAILRTDIDRARAFLAAHAGRSVHAVEASLRQIIAERAA